MYSAGPSTSMACLSIVRSEVEQHTDGKERVPMMGEGPRESRDLVRSKDSSGRETSTKELLALAGELFTAFSSSQTRDGDHFTKSLSSRMDST